MVLISIHPFLFRRILLVVLALIGFSALCFADPVLMARRFGSEKSRIGVAKTTLVAQRTPTPTVNPRLTDLAGENFGWNAALTLEKTGIPDLAATSPGLRVPSCEWGGEALTPSSGGSIWFLFAGPPTH